MDRGSESFGEQLQRFRKEHLLTQQKMAALLGISTNHVSVLERGIKKPRASTEAAFAWLSAQGPEPEEIIRENVDFPWEEVYEKLWIRLCKLDMDRRTEVMSMFFQVLAWTKNG